MMNTKCEIYHDNFQNYKKYGIPKAQLVIADIPYNIGNNFYGSNPQWYNNGNNKDGESKLAGKAAFNSDFNFNIAEYFHFCNKFRTPCIPTLGRCIRGISVINQNIHVACL